MTSIEQKLEEISKAIEINASFLNTILRILATIAAKQDNPNSTNEEIEHILAKYRALVEHGILELEFAKAMNRHQNQRPN